MTTTHRWFEDVVVLECSQLQTPDELWDSYVRAIALDEGESFGRNPDALRDALTGGGPGWPGNVLIEIHNVEALERCGHAELVASLAQIGDELESNVAGPGLRIVRKGAPPRGRLYQCAELTSRELEGAVIERAICWRSNPSDPRGCGLLLIKPSDRDWQRFFLDYGFAVWEEWSEDDVMANIEELSEELEELSATVGERLGVVTFDRTGTEIPAIRIVVGATHVIRFAPKDAADIESAGVLDLL